MNLRRLSLILAAILAVSFTLGAFAQQKGPKLYKWVDKQGVVHYGSSVPPEYANQQLDVLNSEGVTVQTVNAPKTPQEIAKEQQAKTTAAEQAVQQQQQRDNDQMLLDTYTSVADIERDRDSRLAGIASQINVISGSISGLQSSLKEYQQREAGLSRTHKPVPDSLKKDLVTTQNQMATDQQLLLSQQQAKQATQERYAAYIKRFQQLTGTGSGSGGG